MIAVDTNVLVRLLTGDDHKQAAAARFVFENNPIWIAKTVLLETSWVLRSLYGFEESAILEAFTRVAWPPKCAGGRPALCDRGTPALHARD